VSLLSWAFSLLWVGPPAAAAAAAGRFLAAGPPLLLLLLLLLLVPQLAAVQHTAAHKEQGPQVVVQSLIQWVGQV
jgi:hypothetical protein